MPSVAELFETMAWGPAPEAAEPAVAWLDGHERRFGHFVNGQWRAATSTFTVHNPANRQPLAEVAQGTAKDIDAAVKAARKARFAERFDERRVLGRDFGFVRENRPDVPQKGGIGRRGGIRPD